MKIIRQIKPVSVVADNFAENDISLKEFDNEPGYFKANIRPMLAVGHEGELLNYLESIGVLQQHQICENMIDNVVCNGIMVWTPAKVIDQYQLKCKKCNKKATIRSKSIFQDTKCHFRDVIRLIVGWCRGIDEDTMSKLLCIKKQSVFKVYDISAQIAKKYLNSNISRWKLGRPETIILIDTYPEGLLKYNNCTNISGNTITPVLCIMEIQRVPQRYWIQVLERFNIHNTQQIQNVNLAALEVIKEIVVPGSILVTNIATRLCSFDVLQSLKHLYPIIVTVECLQRHNTINIEVLDNLELIWQPAIKTCQRAFKCSNMQTMQTCIISNLWQQQFQTESFEMLLNQMCYNFL